MTQRSAFQAQILEKLGAPLMTAVSEVAARQGGENGGDQKLEAARLAELLGKTVQVSVGLAGSMDLRDADGDSIRLALAAMAGPLVAGQYRLTGKVPGDADIKRMVKALEAVLTFSDNFAPAAENTARLENLDGSAMLSDENQINIQYIGALVPVINAIAAFPFGRAENKLAQEVADRLVGKAVAMGKTLLNGADPRPAKQAELRILRALAALYVDCHEEETARIMALDEQSRASAAEQAGGMLSMDPVWEAFGRRAEMIEIIGKAAAPGDRASAGSAVSAAPAAQAPPEAVAPEAAPPMPLPAIQEAPPPVASPQAAAETGAGNGGAGYSPMSFFKPRGADAAGDNGGEG